MTDKSVMIDLQWHKKVIMLLKLRLNQYGMAISSV